MKINFLIVFILLLWFPFISKCKTTIRQVEIYSITEYTDGFLIKGIDTNFKDTLNIISVKGDLRCRCDYDKIEVGRLFAFEISDYMPSSIAVANDFTIKIKTTVVWRSGDRVKEMPVWARNTAGLLIRRLE